MCQVEHTRQCSINGFPINLAAGIAAYSFFPKKPSIRTQVEESTPRLVHANNIEVVGEIRTGEDRNFAKP